MLEHLVAQLRSRDPPAQSFNPNGFRSLDPDPPQEKDTRRDYLSKRWEGTLQKDEDLQKLYMQLQQAQRLCTELEIAEKILRGKVAEFEVS